MLLHHIALGVVIMQDGGEGLDHPIVFTSHRLSKVEKNYSTTERKGLAMVYALQKYRDYLLERHFKMYTDHSMMKYFINKPVLGGCICRWLLLFQEYDFEFVVKLGRLNAGPNHLSRIETGDEPTSLEEGLPDAQIFVVRVVDGHFEYVIHFLKTGTTPEVYSIQQKKELVVHTTYFSVIVGHLYKMGNDEILRRYVLELEQSSILTDAHGGPTGGHYVGRATAQKILRVGLWCLNLHHDSKTHCKACDVC